MYEKKTEWIADIMRCVCNFFFVINYTYCIISDWFELRTKHRICGSLIGAISSHPRQNDFKGIVPKNNKIQIIVFLTNYGSI